MKAAGRRGMVGEFPEAPNAFALIETPIKDVVGTEIVFRPITGSLAQVVPALKTKFAHAITAEACELPFREGEIQFHQVPTRRLRIF